MLTVTPAIQDDIVFFERIFQIVLALAIGEAFKQYFPEKRSDGHRTVNPESTPALITFLVLSITFYLGMDRYFFRSYIHAPSLPSAYAIHLIVDALLFIFESALIFAMARNLQPDRWKNFYWLVASLLIVDIIWCAHGTLFGPESLKGWIVSDAIFLAIIVALERLRPASDNMASWAGTVISVAITVTGYVLFWPLYFA